jgi:hypothetical protein
MHMIVSLQMEGSTVLFRRREAAASSGEGDGGGSAAHVQAVLARSTAGLRKRLLEADVVFSCPLNPDLCEDDDDEPGCVWSPFPAHSCWYFIPCGVPH